MTLSITLLIILITVGVSLYASENLELKNKMLMNPYSVVHRNQFYKLFSHALIHADFIHLGVNMYVLYSFGTSLETIFTDIFQFGPLYFVLLYVGGILFSCLPSLRKHKDNPHYNSLGASGAVSAVLFSFIILNPSAELGLFGVIPLNAGLFAILFVIYETSMNKRGRTNIAHDAHLLGALFGIIFTILLNPSFVISNFILQIQTIF